jgi:hypothetical protein
MNNLFLEPFELEGLTGRRRPNAQIRVLQAMGIEHKVRPDRTIAVLREHVNNVFSGTTRSPGRRHKSEAPNWAAI